MGVPCRLTFNSWVRVSKRLVIPNYTSANTTLLLFHDNYFIITISKSRLAILFMNLRLIDLKFTLLTFFHPKIYIICCFTIISLKICAGKIGSVLFNVAHPIFMNLYQLKAQIFAFFGITDGKISDIGFCYLVNMVFYSLDNLICAKHCLGTWVFGTRMFFCMCLARMLFVFSFS